MSLASQVSALATRIGTEFKTVKGREGDLASLTTSAKSTLVSAINEVNAKPTSTGGAQINDTTASATSVYSSTKTESVATAAASSAVANRPVINDTTASTSSVYSSSKTDTQITNAISNRPTINDTTASATTVYSSNKTNSAISAAVSQLVNSAPAALDTLKELSDALGGDASFATTTATALGNRLRVDAAQTLTSAQLTQGRSNLGVTASVDIGDTNTDFVATFVAALT